MSRSPSSPVRFATLVAASAIWFASAAHAEPAVKAVGPVGMTVADMERSIAFYSGVLLISDPDGHAMEVIQP